MPRASIHSSSAPVVGVLGGGVVEPERLELGEVHQPGNPLVALAGSGSYDDGQQGRRHPRANLRRRQAERVRERGAPVGVAGVAQVEVVGAELCPCTAGACGPTRRYTQAGAVRLASHDGVVRHRAPAKKPCGTVETTACDGSSRVTARIVRVPCDGTRSG